MALRHAVLAALLDEELSGYQLAKSFDLGVANFWHALPQQLYAELAKLEADGLVSGREVVQETRPNKRLFKVTDEGLAELERFAESSAKPSMLRDDLAVKVQSSDLVDTAAVIVQLRERAEFARAKIALFESLLLKFRGERSEEAYLREGERIGPYLTCLGGLVFERGYLEWCERIAGILQARRDGGEA
ncbi:PadR family transcriptional regulator [Streptomyces sp. TRM66268-LWL]|uniref:PadR family transcriptional regulator n=1 Tax=Streptomyces polyasparticus TaxID=2767826 RepID=A0ABR7SHT8_9ACTN|nr:PadR family transcriptional regulator [Streptomyces polyasparticus]MBC9715086.1 PadR family transcriptional regulator [Streptomyces polyasparticus]